VHRTAHPLLPMSDADGKAARPLVPIADAKDRVPYPVLPMRDAEDRTSGQPPERRTPFPEGDVR
jgi:hypothetical protein